MGQIILSLAGQITAHRQTQLVLTELQINENLSLCCSGSELQFGFTSLFESLKYYRCKQRFRDLTPANILLPLFALIRFVMETTPKKNVFEGVKIPILRKHRFPINQVLN